jgi:hypothetical protein
MGPQHNYSPLSAAASSFSSLSKPPDLGLKTTQRSVDSEVSAPCYSHSTLLLTCRVPVTTIYICMPSFLCIQPVSFILWTLCQFGTLDYTQCLAQSRIPILICWGDG